MASETARTRNGIPNGEDENPPYSPASEGHGSSQPDNPDPEDDGTGQHSGQGTQEADNPTPEEKEEKVVEEEKEDSLPDYEYYEYLESLEQLGADNAKPEGAQGDSSKGTPHDVRPDASRDPVENNEPLSPLPDYEYYEYLDALERSLADNNNPSPKDGQGDPDKGTPHDEHRDTTTDPVESNEPSDSPGANERNGEQDSSNQTSQGSDPKDPQDPPRREVDETSEGTAAGNPPKVNEESSEASSNTKKAGERPVRRQLKKTSIAEGTEAVDSMASSQDSLRGKSGQASETSDNEGRGRMRKRSFDDIEQDDHYESPESKENDGEGHRRKRSRDADDSKSRKIPEGPAEKEPAKEPQAESSPEADAGHASPSEKTEDPSDKLRSPKKKRSRDQFDADRLNATDNSESSKDAAIEGTEGEPEKKRHRDRSLESNSDRKKDEASLPKPFANTSAASPFSTIPPSKSESTKEETEKNPSAASSSAFASSSLSAFAGSEKSPFGTIGSGESVFKSSAATSSEGKEKDSTPSAFAKSAFGAAAANPSALGTLAGGFGGSSAGSAFGSSALKPSGGLTSFASPSGPSVLGSSSKTKVLGEGPSDDEDAGDEDEDEHQGGDDDDVDKQDERFYKQNVDTGEQGERTYFSCRSKLFHFDEGEWKERGVGTFKVNVCEAQREEAQSSEDGGEAGTSSSKKTARLIMRTEGVLRVILNTPLFKGMKVGTPTGEEPSGKQVTLAALEKGKTVPLLLRTGNPTLAKDLYHTIQELLPQL